MKTQTQEPDIVASRPVLVVLGIGVLVTALSVWIVWMMADSGIDERPRDARHRVPSEVNATETRPFDVQAQGLESHEVAESWLGSYGWTDREQGLVHIPIERAMELYLSRRGDTP